jgi:uncharacterized protein YjgD (DUF1641 family)
VELTMTVADVMDLDAGPTEASPMLIELKAISRKLDRMEQIIDAVTYRLESLEDMREDLWPMVQGASHQISAKLHELEQRGAVGFAREALKVGERIATSFTEQDVRLLGENVVHILQTVRNLTQPEVLEMADRAAAAIQETEAHPANKLSLWKAMRDPEIRRGMNLMLTVLRELGHEANAKNQAVATAEAAAE